MKHPILRAGCAVLLFSAMAGAYAQGMPGGGGRHRGGGEMKAPGGTRDTGPRAAQEVDPIAALQRELPSLKADLKLTAEQAMYWDAFAASARQVYNAALNRRKRSDLMRPAGDAATEWPPALEFISGLADDDGRRADGMRDLRDKTAALVAALSAEQRKMFDRRVAQSQREPLGN